MTSRHKISIGLLAPAILSAVATVRAQADDLWQTLNGGEVDLYLRYRFEHVEDDQEPAVEDAYANTLRTALGYNTGLFHGFDAYVQFEDVRAIGNDLYNDGGSDGVTDRAVVVDPESTEVHQAASYDFRFKSGGRHPAPCADRAVVG